MTNLGGGELRVGGWTLEHAACGGHLGFEFDCFPKTNQGQSKYYWIVKKSTHLLTDAALDRPCRNPLCCGSPVKDMKSAR